MRFAFLSGYRMVPHQPIDHHRIRKDITALSEGLWQNDPTQKEAMEAEFLKRYPLLANVPLEERGNYLRKRIESDCVVAGSTIMITLLICWLWSCTFDRLWSPDCEGAERPPAFALDLGATLLAILVAALVGALLLLVILPNGRFNGKTFFELGFAIQFLMVGVPPTLLFLLLRRWKRVKDSCALIVIMETRALFAGDR